MAESYGGKYGPTFASYFEQQNARLDQGLLPNNTKKLYLESLGIGKSCPNPENPQHLP